MIKIKMTRAIKSHTEYSKGAYKSLSLCSSWVGGNVELLSFNTGNAFKRYSADYETQHVAILILEGRAVVEHRFLNAKYAPIKQPGPGDIVFFRSGSNLRGKVQGGLKFFRIFIEPFYIESSFEITNQGKFLSPTFNSRIDAKSYNLAQELAINMEHGTHIDRLLMDGTASLLTHQLMQIATRKDHLTSYYGTLSGPRLNLALDYIESNLHKNITLCDLAVCTHLSLTHFARAFRNAMGVPPHQFIIQKRVECAIDLLCNKNLPISEIALSVGFNSQSHFTTVFRKYTGITPARYRQVIS